MVGVVLLIQNFIAASSCFSFLKRTKQDSDIMWLVKAVEEGFKYNEIDFNKHKCAIIYIRIKFKK